MSQTEIYAWLFVGLTPLSLIAAAITIALYREERSGVTLVLAIAKSAGSMVAVYLGVTSYLYLVDAVELQLLLPFVVPSFLLLEVLFIILPFYLWLRRR